MRKTILSLCGLVLLAVAQAAFAAKPVLGVAEFNNETSAGWWSGGVGQELSGMLSNELSNTGDFTVVERAKLDPVLREQDLSAAGALSGESAARVGEITGAQYLVLGTVSAFESNTSSTGGGISFGGISIGGKKGDAYMAIDLRVVDTTTSQIVHSRTVEGRASSSGISLGLFKSGFGGRLKNENKTPTGKAIRAALVESVDYLVCAMVTQTQRCMDEFDAKEQKRRDSLKDTINLDGP
ncbi:MAG: CsgG/HfaB family protein [Gammaproteobacteria bacterium]|nr:CsgG/HfaB family protein [Gammaproteobacteria bacterium]